MIDKLLNRKEFKDKPPVLLDIGASGGLPEQWKKISTHSVCVAFDGDEREFAYIEEKKKQFSKLVIVNKVVTDSEGSINFYLTKSPFCSSTLKPETGNLANYAFAELFKIDKVLKLESVSLAAELSNNNIDYIDWFKTDTQGTDLRLIKSLKEDALKKVIVYELEPGIIDAYENEDKLYSVLQFFNQQKFITVDANIKGSCRINVELAKTKLPADVIKNINGILPATPDWCEISFFNSFSNPSFTIREYILGWIFATIKKQHGLALEIANKGLQLFNDNDFEQMLNHTVDELNKSFRDFTIQSKKDKIKRKLKKLFS